MRPARSGRWPVRQRRWQGWMKPGGLERDRIGRETRQSIRRRERKGGAGSFNRLGPRLRIPQFEEYRGGPESRPLLGRWNGGPRFGFLAIAVTAAPVRAVFGECAAL